MDAGIEFKDFILGFRQSIFLCTTLKCIEQFRIPFIKSGIPASNLGSSEARNPAKFAACGCHRADTDDELTSSSRQDQTCLIFVALTTDSCRAHNRSTMASRFFTIFLYMSHWLSEIRDGLTTGHYPWVNNT